MSTVSDHKRQQPGPAAGPSLGGLFAPLPPEPLVSVVMTMFNSEATLEAGVRSLMNQTYRNLEIILSDDGSSDGTVALARKLCAEDGRISLLEFGGNHGTYWAKNYGMRRSRGHVVTFADSDDTSDPRRIELQLLALRAPGVAVSTCAYSRVDETGGQLPVPGSRGFAFISQMIRRDVLEMVGYFDSTRTSADDEMLNRILISFGAGAHSIVSERLYTAVVREGSLSHNKDNPRYSPVTKGLSPPRRAYAEGFRAWHARVLEAGAVPYIPFPVSSRPFPLDPKLEVRSGDFARNFISVVAWGSGPDSDARAVELARQCARDATCSRSWRADPGFEGDLWKIHRVSSETEARDFAGSQELPSGYVVFCDLNADGLPGEFVQRVLMEVERGRRPGVPGLVDPSKQAGRTGRLHGRGGHTEGKEDKVAGFADGASAQTLPGNDPGALGAKPIPSQESATNAANESAPLGEASVPLAAGRGALALRDGTSLFRQFLSLWSRSEQVIALLLGAGLAVMVLGLLTPWIWVPMLGMSGVLGGIGLAVLLNTRRTRLLADPAIQLDSQQRLSVLATGLGVFRQTHLGRGPKVLAKPPAVSTMEPRDHEHAAKLAPRTEVPVGDLRRAVREIRELPAAAGLARLSQIQARYNVSPDIGHALTTLRVVLLIQVGRQELAKAELARMSSTKGGAARKWSDRGHAWVDGHQPLKGAVEAVVEEVVTGLEVNA